MERNIRILKWSYGLIGFLPASAIWIIYFAKVGGSLTAGAAVFTMGMVIAAVFDLPLGAVSDKYGRKLSAEIAAISLLLCVILYAVAQNWWQLLIAAVFDGLGIAAISGNAAALMHESLVALGREDEFSFHYGRMQAWSHWAAFAAAIVGAVVATFSLRWTVAIGAFSFAPCVALAFMIKEPPRHVDHVQTLTGHVTKSFGLILTNKRLGLVALASMVSGGVSMCMFQLRPTWISHLWPIWALGIVRAASAVWAAVGSWWGGSLIKKFGALRCIVMTQVGSSVIDIAMLISGSVVAPAVLTAASFPFGIGTIAENSILQEEFSDEQRATLGSFVGVGTRLTYAFGAVGFAVLGSHQTLALVLGELIMIGSVGMFVKAFPSSSAPVGRPGTQSNKRVERASYVSG